MSVPTYYLKYSGLFDGFELLAILRVSKKNVIFRYANGRLIHKTVMENLKNYADIKDIVSLPLGEVFLVGSTTTVTKITKSEFENMRIIRELEA